jgi:4-amino-4-deoxy-L-arabinose transferase-like glycosyltransferase
LQPSTLAKRAWLLLFVTTAAFYLFGLGRLPFVGPDEPRYAEVAREMFLRHDLVTPTLGGHTWFEKPALLYWMMIGSFTAFGVSEWAARLGPAISGLVTIAAVYWISHRVELKDSGEKKDSGIYSALVLASSAGLIVFARGASFDIIITATTTVALVSFLAAEIDDGAKHSGWLLAAFYCFVGLSLLAKGLVGIVIPFGVVFAYYSLRRRLPRRQIALSLIWGVPLALGVAAVWYGPVIARNGWPFIDQFFIQHHFARYLSNKYRHPQPFYFYLLIMLLLTLPWTPFLIDALSGARRWQWRAADAENKSSVFALAWLAVPIIFFSFSGSKLPAYILPSLPAAAWLAGGRVERLVRETSKGNWAMRTTAALLLLLALSLVIYAQRSGGVSLPCTLMVVGPLVLAGLFVFASVRWQRRLAAVFIAAAVFGATDLALFCAVEKLARRESVRELVQLAAARGYDAAPLFALHDLDRTVEFYAAGRVVYGADGEPIRFETAAEVANQARHARRPMLVILPVGRVSQLTALPGLQTTLIGDNGAMAIVAVTAD